MAARARRVAGHRNATSATDLGDLRAADCDDVQILAITLFVALRLAFASINDVLGARPDRVLHESVPGVVRDAVTWRRPVDP